EGGRGVRGRREVCTGGRARGDREERLEPEHLAVCGYIRGGGTRGSAGGGGKAEGPGEGAGRGRGADECVSGGTGVWRPIGPVRSRWTAGCAAVSARELIAFRRRVIGNWCLCARLRSSKAVTRRAA